MELTLKRTFHPKGTNGKLMNGEQLVCNTIELPWLNNRRNVSCIPNGRYQISKRFTTERGWHLHVEEVPNRSWILIHPANNALKELKGCIAPVSKLTGHGLGSSSRKANEKLEGLLYPAFRRNEEVFLNIKNDTTMNIIDRVKAPTPKFFKTLRTIGVSLVAAGTVVMVSPVALPTGLVSLGEYLVASGGVLSAVSQTAVDENAQP
ncbi:DUF5675 family protein [Reichenbachiella sp. MALMAid0571]|uniref:DUF5675 family protein n=1 Tax=Reichenbachiella sp. MALMAid0571 TaxID=3143939 RepID=UPI0032DEA785